MRKTTILFLVTFFSFSALAQQQQRGMRWGGGVDYDKIHFGFSFHYVASSFKVFKNANWQDASLDINNQNDEVGQPLGTLNTISSPMTHGVGLGILADVKLGERTNLRFSPNVLFTDKELKYEFNTTEIDKKVKASLLELPLTFKYKSDRRKNYGLYLLGGGKFSQNIASKDKINAKPDASDIDKMPKLKSGFISYELGLGIDIYFEYFKMSPEIKWSQSVGNVLDKENPNMFNTPIDKLLLRSIQFSLIFE